MTNEQLGTVTLNEDGLPIFILKTNANLLIDDDMYNREYDWCENYIEEMRCESLDDAMYEMGFENVNKGAFGQYLGIYSRIAHEGEELDNKVYAVTKCTENDGLNEIHIVVADSVRELRDIFTEKQLEKIKKNCLGENVDMYAFLNERGDYMDILLNDLRSRVRNEEAIQDYDRKGSLIISTDWVSHTDDYLTGDYGCDYICDVVVTNSDDDIERLVEENELYQWLNVDIIDIFACYF